MLLNFFYFLYISLVIFLFYINTDFSLNAKEIFRLLIFISIISFGYIIYILKTLKLKKYNLQYYLFYFISIYYLGYIYVQGIIYLPESIIPNQKYFLKFFLYSTILYLILNFKKKNFSRLFYTTLTASMILPLVWGYLLSGSGYGLGVGYILLYLIRKKLNLTYFHNYFIIFLFYILISFLFHEYKSNFFTGFYLYSIIFFMSIILNIEKEKIKLYVTKTYINYLIVQFIFFLGFYFYQGAVINEKSIGSFQVNSIGNAILFLIPLSIYYFTIKFKNIEINIITISKKIINDKYLILFFLGIIISFILLIMTKTRSAGLNVFLFAFFYFIYIYLYKKNIFKRFYIYNLLLVFFLGNVLWNLIKKKGFESIFVRFDIWEMYWNLLIKNNIIFGNGFQCNSLIIYENILEYISSHPIVLKEMIISNIVPHSHNFFIQMISEYGLIGLCLFLLSFFILFFKKTNYNNSLITSSLKIFILSFFLSELFDYLIMDPNIILGLSILIGLIINNREIFISNFNKNTIIFFLFTFIVLLPTYILSINKINYLILKNTISISNFNKISISSEYTYENFKYFYFLEKISFGLYLDDKMALYSGVYYLMNSKNNNEFINMSKSRFQNCLFLNPKNHICKLLYENPDISKENINKINQLNPILKVIP